MEAEGLNLPPQAPTKTGSPSRSNIPNDVNPSYGPVTYRFEVEGMSVTLHYAGAYVYIFARWAYLMMPRRLVSPNGRHR